MNETNLQYLLAKEKYDFLVKTNAVFVEGSIVLALGILKIKPGEIHGICQASIVKPSKGVHRNSTLFKAPDVQKIFHAKRLRTEFEVKYNGAFQWNFVKDGVLPLVRKSEATFFNDEMGQVVINEMFLLAK